jgi:hypothetical protein
MSGSVEQAEKLDEIWKVDITTMDSFICQRITDPEHLFYNQSKKIESTSKEKKWDVTTLCNVNIS